MPTERTPQEFYNAFRRWAIQKHGWGKVFRDIRFSREQFRNSPEYQEWVNAGAPGWGTRQQWAQQDIEERQERLSPFLTEQGIPSQKLTEADISALQGLGWTSETQTSPFGTKQSWWKPPEATPTEAQTEEEKRYGYTMAEWGMGIPLQRQQMLQSEAGRLQEQNRLAMEADQLMRGMEWMQRQNQLLSQGGMGGLNIRAQQAEEFETWRNRLLGQMTGPAYSVARWFVQHKQNPYVPSAVEGIERDIGTREVAMGGLEAVAGQGPGGIDAQIGAKAQQLAQEIEGLRSEAEEVERDREEALALSRRGPETPAWMPEYVPGVGKYLGSLPRVPTPSGQQLTKMQPSQSQYLAGAIDWFGGRPWEDILAQAEVMQPYAPRRTATQWRPQTQRRV